jgi:hypothetical protein
LNKVQFDSIAFQERNGTCGMKPERSGRNLAEKSGTNQDLKWDEIFFVLFLFLNWYGMFRQFRAKRNEINMNTQIMKTCLREQIIYKIEHKCLKCMDIALVSIDYFFLYRKIKTKNVLHRWFTMIKLNYDNKLKIYFIKIAQNIFFKNEQFTS